MSSRVRSASIISWRAGQDQLLKYNLIKSRLSMIASLPVPSAKSFSKNSLYQRLIKSKNSLLSFTRLVINWCICSLNLSKNHNKATSKLKLQVLQLKIRADQANLSNPKAVKTSRKSGSKLNTTRFSPRTSSTSSKHRSLYESIK